MSLLPAEPWGAFQLLERAYLFVLLTQGHREIFKCVYKGETFAAKTLFRDTAKILPPARADLEKEISFLSELKHPHVLRLAGVCMEDPASPIVLLDMCATTLEARIILAYQYDESKREKLTDAEKFRMAFELASALEYLAQNNVLHRDLKPANGALFASLVRLRTIFNLLKQFG
jgi:serine/threonine protein kinase